MVMFDKENFSKTQRINVHNYVKRDRQSDYQDTFMKKVENNEDASTSANKTIDTQHIHSSEHAKSSNSFLMSR